MSFKVYDYLCRGCGTTAMDEWVRAGSEDDQMCECGAKLDRLLCAPRLDIVGMANNGCPGALSNVQDQIEAKHRKVDQSHRKGTG